MKHCVVLALLLACSMLLAGCALGEDSIRYIPAEELTEEAASTFQALNGKHGVMVYDDSLKQTRGQGVLYAVLYGESGHALTYTAKRDSFTLQISGEPMEGYAVWRIQYKRGLIRNRKVSFMQNDEVQTMDGVEALRFVVEKALQEPADSIE